jgi:hypothetical protein
MPTKIGMSSTIFRIRGGVAERLAKGAIPRQNARHFDQARRSTALTVVIDGEPEFEG